MSEPDLLDSPEAGGTAIRGVLVRSVLFGGGLVVSLVTVPFVVRHLGPVDYGYYVTVSAIVFIIAGVTEGGLNNLGIRHYASGRDPEEQALIVRNLVGVRLVITTASLLVVTAVAAIAGAAHQIVVGIPLYGAGMLFSMISLSLAVPLQAQLRLGIASALEFLRQLVNAGGTLALVAAGAGLYAFFGIWVLACAVAAVATAAIVRRTVSVRPSFHWPTWRRFFGEAVAYGIAAAAALVYFRVAATLMTFLSTPEETGYFAMAFRVLETGTMIPLLLVSSVFPILARAASTDRLRLRYATQKVVEVGVIAGLGLALLLMVGATPVVQIVGGPEFAPAVPVLRVQAAVLIATVFVATWSMLLLSLDEQKALLAINATAVVVAVIGAFALIPPFGAIGGSVDVLIAEVVTATASVWVLWRRHHDVAPDLRPLWKVLAAAALGAAVAIPLGDVVGTIAAGVVFVTVLFALRAIPMELFHALRAGARR